VQRDITAINYLHRSDSTRLKFVGTELLPGADGKAEVKSERGGIHIHAEFKHLTPANGFGPEYLTYVLWAISPDGRPQNLGEVLPAGTSSNIDATTSMQAFGLIVTAEPYYAVSTPSDLIVLKNEPIPNQTNGIIQPITAHATLLPRGIYTEATDGARTVARPITRNERSPLELYQAYNAVRIAEATGAGKYSPEILAKAQQELKNAADLDASKHRDRKLEITYARGAVQRAEDARIDTLRKQAAERTRQAEQQRDLAQTRAADAQAVSQQAQEEAARARAQTDQANQDAKRAQEAKQAADAEAANAHAQAAQSSKNAQQARENLRKQLNMVLQTTETARGLIVNMSDVLFDTGKYTLKQGTQISLAKVAGILQAHPSLKVQVEGYTDSTGSPTFNQTLSENRAGAVRNFLIQQGVTQDNISAKGFGATDFVADNKIAAGRAQNRRVNLVVSGEEIGVQQTQGPDADEAQPQEAQPQESQPQESQPQEAQPQQ
jgi:outer membrane protein OmpA-like peptidoglycan-associated protein